MQHLQDAAPAPEPEAAPEPSAVPGEGPASVPAPAPMVVVEYRSRGLPAVLLPPALVLLAALGITSYQRLDPGRFSRFNASAPRPAAPAPRVEPPSRPLEVRIVTTPAQPPAAAPAPESAPAADEPPVPEPRPIEIAAVPRPPIGFQPPAEDNPPPPAAEGPVARPGPGPLPAKEQVWDEIRREAAQKEADIRRLEALKPRLRAWQRAETLRKIQDSRAPFLNDLRQLLKVHGAGAGPAIARLCDQYGRVVPDEVQAIATRALNTTFSGLSRASRVEKMRELGLPEPLILDDLARQLHKTINQRGGPRDAQEVRVRAARLLLSMPPRQTASAR